MIKISSWLKYYRASLIDGSRGEKSNILPESLNRKGSFLGMFTEYEVLKIWDEEKIYKFNFNPIKEKKLTSEEKLEKKNDFESSDLEGIIETEEKLTEINKIEIAPVSISTSFEHGEKIGDTKFHFPFWIPAYMDKQGNLYPPVEGELPLFIRNYLEPNPRDLPSIATMEKLDEQLANRGFDKKDWFKYWIDCETFFKDITGKKFKDFQRAQYYQFSICKMEESNVTRNILSLYNTLIAEKNGKNYPLLHKILEDKEEPENIKLDEVEVFLNPNHFGQMNGEFPLSHSQRIVFAQFSSKHNKQLFAINGPPGTGKTTILQSVIANLITLSVLSKKATPLIVGCSTNNQTITNILDSMELKKTDDVLAQRWLPNIKSFGLYLAASSKKNAAKKYQIETSSFLNNGFVKEFEDKAKIEYYKSHFLEKFTAFFTASEYDADPFSLDPIEAISTKISNTKQKIKTLTRIALRKHEVKSLLKNKGYENLEALINEIENTEKEIQKTKEHHQLLTKIKTELIERNRQFPFYIKWFPLKRYRRLRNNAYQLICQPIFDSFSKTFKWHNFHSVISQLEKMIFENTHLLNEFHRILSELQDFQKDIKKEA